MLHEALDLAGSCENGKGLSDFIKGGDVLDDLIVLSASQKRFCSMELI
jgi:hypothetical protein